MDFKLIVCAAAIASFLGAAAQKVETYKASEALPLLRPVMTDTASVDGAKYTESALLNVPVAIADGLFTRTISAADTSGYVSLPRGTRGDVMYVLQTRLCPERFTKGSVEVESDAMFEILVDKQSKAKKEVAEDSISSASKQMAALSMDPATEHTLTIKVLVQQSDSLPPVKLRAAYVADEGDSTAVKIYPDGKRAFELRDIAIGKRVTDASISPDGRYMLTRFTDRLSADNMRTSYTITDLKTGKDIPNALSAPVAWMPSGSKLYYTVKTPDGYDVYTIEMPTMKEERVLTSVPDNNFFWAPDCSFLVYYKDAEVKKPGAPLRRYTSPDDRIPGDRDRRFAQLFNTATGVSTPLVFGSRTSTVLDVRPDSKALLLAVRDYDATDWPFYFTSLYEIDLTTMAADTVFTKCPSLSDANYSPDGRQLFVTAGPGAFDNIGLNSGNHPLPNDFDIQGFLVDMSTKKVKAMTRDFNPSISGQVKWHKASNTIYMQAENGFDRTIYALDPVSGNIRQIPQEITYVQGFSIGDDENAWMAYYGQSYDASGRAYLIDMKTGKQTLTADPWKPVADEIEWGGVKRWTFTASDGTEIDGFITTPPGFDPQKKYPMIVYYYGGTSPTIHNTYSPYNAQLFASRGYVVYQINPSGTTGYGQEFSARHVNAWGDYTINDIIEGVELMVKEHPYVDASKIGCIGASYGGFITQYLMTKTDIFAAAVSHAGISNVTSYWGEGYWGYSYNSVAAAKSYPWTNPELFTQHGSLFNADKIHTPLLLTHGTADTNVPMGESVQLFNALKILGREVEMVTVDDEDHFISGYDNRIAWQNTIMAWFAKWLQNDPRWWQEMYK